MWIIAKAPIATLHCRITLCTKRSLRPSNLGIDYGTNLQCAWGR